VGGVCLFPARSADRHTPAGLSCLSG
jgi:hypothetical protein